MTEAQGDRFHGLELRLRTLSGAAAARVIHPGGQQIGAHRHEWPYLGLHQLGGYHERFDGGEAWIDAPSAVFHPAGRDHEDVIGAAGLETVTIEFDPAWLDPAAPPRIERSRVRLGGAAAAAARRLVALWSDEATPEARLREATAACLALLAREAEPPREPRWLAEVRRALNDEAPPGAAELARRHGLHPGWLAQAYRARAGEGLHETARRKRVERAMSLMRGSDAGLAEIALACGFCDQSHMNRVFRTVVGRTPLDVRRERRLLESFAAAA